jgi:kynureninase
MNDEQAISLDSQDPLAPYRANFILDESEVYLDGNSLGPLLHSVKTRLTHTIEQQWGKRLIRSWNEGWIDLPQSVARKVAPIIGAKPEDVICADTVSVNLFKLLAASLQDSSRNVILSVRDMFPTDLYIGEGLARLVGPDKCELKLTSIESLAEALDERTNVLLLSQVNFRSGEAYDIDAITKMAHAAGARVLWDLSHSAGVLPINLAECHVDFAVGCGYKFLNGGPGAPAFVYVDRDLQGRLQQPLSGWMGHKSPFEFNPSYTPAPGMDQFLAGTPGILSMSALDAALDIWKDVELELVFKKSQLLTAYFIEGIEQSDHLVDLSVIKPSNRGSQVSLTHEAAFPISQALIEAGIICDFRAPNLIRFGFAPLYNRFQDVAKTVSILEEIMSSKRYAAAQYQVGGKVT